MGQRPPHVKPPEYLSRNPPVPEPEAVPVEKEGDDPLGLNPVRYGDWELKGIAIDF
ncbi:MAG: DUF1674 domain-containing protein [Sphingomonas sp. 28-62-20]|uniref:DUF1674 domain-containing protein n=1 Tax=Sphingomonas sp. 28-62-20 TaxID=1970433 RepID=UPI000BD84AEC|nr:MAG: DUF1674 domain-containing protein [Sphingomonas sp. 28-62-20]